MRLTWAAWDAARLRGLTLCFSTLTWLRLKLAGAEIGPNLTVRGWVDLHIDRRAAVQLGANCRINSGFAVNAVGGFRRTGLWVGRDGRLTIGSNVGLSSLTIVCVRAVNIEDDVFIGGDCNIYDTDFHSIRSEQRLARPDTTVKTAPILIGRRSFIGAHSIILKGVTIGAEAVIGAGSVVTKDVPTGEIWVGNPARKVGYIDRSKASSCLADAA